MTTAPGLPGSWTTWLFRRVDIPAAYLVLAALAWLCTVVPTLFGTALTAPENRSTLVVSFVAVMLGEIVRVRLVGEREAAPMSVACAFAFVFYTQTPIGNPVTYNAREVVAVCGLAMAFGGYLLHLRRHVVRKDEMAARIISIGVASVVFRDLPLAGGMPLAEWFARHPDQAWLCAAVTATVSVVSLMAYAFTMGTHNAAIADAPVLPSIIAEARALVGLNAALGATGALIAAAALPMGLWALPLFVAPLLFTLFAVGQHAAVRATQRETIRALARVTELAGYTSTGHAERVAELAITVGRDLGMSERDLQTLEYAALLHDLGQVCIVEPLPQGATVLAAPTDQQQIGADSADILGRIGVFPEVARTLRDQATPYRQVREFGQDLPLASRIIKVVNAYDDFVQVLQGKDRQAAAIERMHLGLGYEYDPHVVDALVDALRRRAPQVPAPQR
ncbi:MAG TPA: HD domain-containing protein [Dermatophilaceae bacterium]|nr:HD domain-containing protein [Dermatophilaceae bacterium]